MTPLQNPLSRYRKTLLLVALALLAGGCASTRTAQTAGETAFPDPARSSVKGGMFVTVDRLRQFGPQMDKSQIQALFGHPHFNEGMWGVREWNYLFNVRRPSGAAPLSCQLQVQFDGKGVATAEYWKPSACAALLTAAPDKPVAATPTPVAVPPAPITPVRLSSDALFDFDSDALKLAGRQSLAGLVLDARKHGAIQAVSVVGYTDRLGDEAHNAALSQRRAETVRDFIVALGVSSGLIRAEGRGASNALVECPGHASADVIACLAPNRRVEISGLIAQRD